MTRPSTTTPKFAVGDEVLVPFDMGLMWPARIVRDGTHEFCTTCHCIPPDPDHEFDGSICCPGPWYAVTVTDPNGNTVTGLHTYAEHEITPIP